MAAICLVVTAAVITSLITSDLFNFFTMHEDTVLNKWYLI
jgi:formate hydrogenlyase subunit 3/multisubunit Na+/H+ antiporter MnhD subunit